MGTIKSAIWANPQDGGRLPPCHSGHASADPEAVGVPAIYLRLYLRKTVGGYENPRNVGSLDKTLKMLALDWWGLQLVVTNKMKGSSGWKGEDCGCQV